MGVDLSLKKKALSVFMYLRSQLNRCSFDIARPRNLDSLQTFGETLRQRASFRQIKRLVYFAAVILVPINIRHGDTRTEPKLRVASRHVNYVITKRLNQLTDDILWRQ